MVIWIGIVAVWFVVSMLAALALGRMFRALDQLQIVGTLPGDRRRTTAA